ncbi:gcc2 and gcc3 domain-containing protein [Cystoisospora suis]|uniref:Gcc2 and gcc3 domain-containing protein n=1 Tax=Cystoisospora suis TaxID=483139 RepID=A0A2C6KUG2_9APIC|nr:gcc2 and gcc3 domain-containing protein [Cystoisospora suis]
MTDSQEMRACPPGTHTRSAGATSLHDCIEADPGGFVSYHGAPAPEGPCAAGYYCPRGSTSAHQRACPSGTYLASTGGTELSECKACPEGFECLKYSTGDVIRACPQGHYCPEGTSWGAKPCPVGTYRLEVGGTRRADCHPCSPGMYCSETGLTVPVAPCAAGYLCLGGASSGKPPNDQTGSRCSAGGFCPEGAIQKFPCPAGTYNPREGGESDQACEPCPAGKYCSGTTRETPDGDCSAGFVCTGAAASADEAPAEPGHYTEEGATEQSPCSPGSYTEKYGQSQCTPCPSGYFCDEPGMSSLKMCPASTYCEESSESPTKCPAGTFSATPLQSTIAGCQDCPPGHFCPTPGRDSPAGPCSAGFYCLSQSTTAEPPGTPSTLGGPCPVGHYCVAVGWLDREKLNSRDKSPGKSAGSEKPAPCPLGTTGPSAKQQSDKGCRPCQPGYYCATSGLAKATTLCQPGFTCPGGSSSGRQQLCSAGHMCPAGSSYETQCPEGEASQLGSIVKQNNSAPLEASTCYISRKSRGVDAPKGKKGASATSAFVVAGTYQAKTGQSDCTKCPRGYHCTPGGRKKYWDSACPAGKYCPDLGTLDQVTCEEGTYSTREARVSSSECLPCPPGRLCKNPESLPSGGAECPAGFYCKLGVWGDVSAHRGARCPRGFYCPAGVGEPVPCPAGRDSPGRICPDSECCAYTCIRAEEPPYLGKICPSTSLGDPAGDCPASRSCPEGSADGVPCAKGAYCPEGSSAPLRCPPGTMSPFVGNAVEIQCTKCPAGKYCEGPTGDSSEGVGSTVPTGDCKAGYYCPEGSYTELGTLCPRGSFCPEGSAVPTACPAANTTPAEGLSKCIGCVAGMSCQRGTVTACDLGYFCREGELPKPCPAGTYSPYRGGVGPDSCLPCAPGTPFPALKPLRKASRSAGKPLQTWSTELLYRLGYRIRRLQKKYSRGCDYHLVVRLVARCSGCSYWISLQMSPAVLSDTLLGQACRLAEFKPKECHGGYFCLSGTTSARPADLTQQEAEAVAESRPGAPTTGGGKCPRGFFCPEGSERPSPCPSGRSCGVTALAEPQSVCSAGYFCRAKAQSDSPSATEYLSKCPSSNLAGPCPPGMSPLTSG